METLTLSCLQWDFYDQLKTNDEHSTILGWCLDRNNQQVLVIIKDYDITMEMEFPQWIDSEFKDWQKDEVDNVVDDMLNKFPFSISAKTRQKELMYYHKNNVKSIAVKLSFETVEKMNNFKSTFSSFESDYGLLTFRFWESNPTVLSPIRKLLTNRKLKYCQWMTIEGKTRRKKISRIVEYAVSYKSIVPIDTTKTLDWQVKPLILSFDTEAHSHNTRCFPDHYDKRDVNWCTSMVVKRYLEEEYAVITVLLLDKKLKNRQSKKHSTPSDVVIYASSEKDYYKKITDVINSISPDIITGYNIYGFDFLYWICRMNTYTSSKVLLMGKLKKKPASTNCLHYNRSWGSSASKMVSVIGIETFGIVVFDVYQYMMREQVGKSSYKLDAIANEVLGVGKDPITPKFMFEVYNAYLAGSWDVPILYQNKQISLNDALELVYLYCNVDALRPLQIIDKLKTLDALFTMASICGLNPVEIYSGGTGKRTRSLLYDNIHSNYIMDSYVPTVKNTKGAHVFDVIPGYHPFTILLDFQSLYPSIIMAYNLCYTTLLRLNELRLYKKGDYQIFTTDRDDGTPTTFPFMKKNKKEGIFPKIMKELLAERAYVREVLMPAAKEEVRAGNLGNLVVLNKLNCLQLALKIVANASYGYVCSNFSDFACKEVGETICYIGRNKITEVARKLQELFGGIVVAGDTDSVMLTLKNVVSSLKELDVITDKVLNTINGTKDTIVDGEVVKGIEGWFVAPMFMNLEHKMAILVVKKKNYAFCIYCKATGELERDKDGNLNIKFKGLPVVKKENCLWMKSTYIKIVGMIFEFATFKECLEVMMTAIKNYVRGKVDINDLVMISSVGQSYSVGSNCPMRVFSERLALKGMPVEPGELLNYVVIHRDSTRKGDKMYLLEEYYSDLDNDIEVDFDDSFYITSAMKKVCSLLCAVFDPEKTMVWKEKKTYTMERLTDYIYDRMVAQDSYRRIHKNILDMYDNRNLSKKDVNTSDSRQKKSKVVEL